MTAKSFVIRTKLVPPVRETGLVARERLLSTLVGNADRRLALVKAPAGYGKTTLVGQWFATLNPSTELGAWYSLDAADNELGRFFTYLVASVQLRLPGFGEAVLEQLTGGVRLSVTSLAGAFINEVHAIDRRVHLVIDDFHLLDNSAVLDAMCQVVLNAPPNLHLVIASRESPPLPLGRLRALGRLAEINNEDLRFRGPETGAFLSLAGHTALSPEQIDTLERHTEGWVAGLQLASISLATQKEAHEFIIAFSGSHGDVADFLTEDVLQRQDPETREFLLQTSILDRLSPALCDAVTGKDNGRRMLTTLEARSLFIFSLDTEGVWFRYHHLFAEFLQRRLETDMPTQAQVLHRRASQWFGDHGYFDEAIRHALNGGDMGRAAQLLNETCDALFYGGRLGALAEWYHQIPQMQLRKFPRILLDQAWLLILEWQFDPARRILDDVQRLLKKYTDTGKQDMDTVTLWAILKHRNMMYALFRDEMQLVDTLCNEMLQEFPVTDPYLHGSLYTCVIYARREMFDFGLVDRYDLQAQELYEESGSRFVFIWHNSILGPTELARGNLDRAENLLSSARRIATETSGERSPLAAMPGLLLAEVFYERNQLDATQWLLDEYLPLADQIGFVDQLIAGFITQARLLAAAGNADLAAATLTGAEALSLKRGFERLAAHIVAERVRQALLAGNLELVKGVAQAQFAQTKMTDMLPCADSSSRHAIMAMTWCRLAYINGRLDDTVALCNRWIRFTHERGARRSLVKFTVLLAHAHRQRGEKLASVRTLRKAVAIASRAGFVRSLIDQPEVTPALLKTIVNVEGAEYEYISRYANELLMIIAPEFAAANPGSNPDRQVSRVVAPAEPLSEREREILQFVASGLLNREIGDMLGLTEGTVKWHLQHIFDKFGTRRRTQAVERARELGFLH